jgi:ribosomal protein L4
VPQVFNVTGRAHPTEADVPGVVGGGVATGPPPQRIMQKVVLASSRALTKQPLALLVDGESASASEILAGKSASHLQTGTSRPSDHCIGR